MIGLPYLLAACALVGALVGSCGMWNYKDLQVREAKADLRDLERKVGEAEDQARMEASKAQGEIDSLVALLAMEQGKEEVRYVEVERQIPVVTRVDHVCLSPVAASLFDRPASGIESEDQDTRVAAAKRALGLTTDPPRPAGGAVSERSITEWMNAAHRQYSKVARQLTRLQDIVRQLPCVEIVEGE